MIITALEPDRRDERRVVARCGRRVLARLDDRAVEQLGLAAGVEVTEALRLALEAAERVLDARDAGLRLLRVKARSRAELLARLAAKGFDERACAGAVERLERVGLIDDARLARDVADRHTQRGASRRLVEAKLEARGLETGAARVDDTDAALREAREAISAGRGADMSATARRALGRLARKGFDEETAREAVERALREAGMTFGAGPDELTESA